MNLASCIAREHRPGGKLELICSLSGAQLALDSLDELGLIVAEIAEIRIGTIEMCVKKSG